MTGKRRPTRAEAEELEAEYVCALNAGRDAVAAFRDGKTSEAFRKAAMAEVDRTELAYLAATRRILEANVQDAADVLGCEVVWGK
jgi:hypothetical protein